ncbi:MAG: M15 family metallopeptidase [Treponema sp.]|nr:M15 family metallopeptidase [Candidatus Treponema equifaecale]
MNGKMEKVDSELVEEDFMESSFYVSEIDSKLFGRMKGKSFKDDCTVPVSELRYLHLLHWDLNDVMCEGEMVCNREIADVVLKIFKELYVAHYKIEKIRLVDEYDADDERSMSDNNSSCFNFRFISHTTEVSKHGAGLAIDINPLYNPYVKQVNGRRNVEPANGVNYIERNANFPCKIDHNDLAYKLFTSRGFEWGGDWKNVKDYQHFEFVPPRTAD